MGAGLGRDWYILGGWRGWEKDLLVVLGWAGLPGLDWERKRGMRMDARGVSWRGHGAGGIQQFNRWFSGIRASRSSSLSCPLLVLPCPAANGDEDGLLAGARRWC